MAKACVCFEWNIGKDDRAVTVNATCVAGTHDRYTSYGWVQGDPAEVDNLLVLDAGTGEDITNDLSSYTLETLCLRALELAGDM
jgi:hypothetical protein